MNSLMQAQLIHGCCLDFYIISELEGFSQHLYEVSELRV